MLSIVCVAPPVQSPICGEPALVQLKVWREGQGASCPEHHETKITAEGFELGERNQELLRAFVVFPAVIPQNLEPAAPLSWSRSRCCEGAMHMHVPRCRGREHRQGKIHHLAFAQQLRRETQHSLRRIRNPAHETINSTEKRVHVEARVERDHIRSQTRHDLDPPELEVALALLVGQLGRVSELVLVEVQHSACGGQVGPQGQQLTEVEVGRGQQCGARWQLAWDTARYAQRGCAHGPVPFFGW